MKARKIIKIIIGIIVIAVISLTAYFNLNKQNKTEYTTVKVERGQLIQTVSETGTIKAASAINLNFSSVGKVNKILVKIGDKVNKDQILAGLDYSELINKQNEAKANLAASQATLLKYSSGATREEINVAAAGVAQAESLYAAASTELEKVKNTLVENINQAKKSLDDLLLDSNKDVTTYEQAVKTAENNLENAKSTYSQSINNKKNSALTTMEEKLSLANIALDSIDRVIKDEDVKDILSIENTIYSTNTINTSDEAQILLTSANASLAVAKYSKNNNDIVEALDDSQETLNKIFASLDYCFKALENTIITSDLTQADLDSLKATINSQITIITTAIYSINTSKQNLSDAMLAYDTNVSTAAESLSQANTNLNNAIINARNALASAEVNGAQQINLAESKVEASRQGLAVAESKLNQLKSPTRFEDILLYQAQVEIAKAAYDAVAIEIDNKIIKAPIGGLVTKVNYEVGEQVSVANPVISMLGENNFEIEVLISETDITKVKIGNLAEITMDAFGENVIFQGKVNFIEPAETIIQDVIYYQVDVGFIDIADGSEYKTNLENIKSGMTANAVITTARKDNILIIPARAVIDKNGNKYARILANNQIKEAVVTLGLRGDGGMTEVLSGAKEGDEVVTFVKDSK